MLGDVVRSGAAPTLRQMPRSTLPPTAPPRAARRQGSGARRSTYRSRGRRRRRLVLVVVLAGSAVLAAALALGGSPSAPPKPPRPFTVGRGARSALVLPGRGPVRRATVIFLHGWGLTGRQAYGAWLRHLTARGSTVIVPRYQTSLRTQSLVVPGNAIAGIRSALRRIEPRPATVVVAGHSVGGVLALDYAVRARGLRLPPAAAVLSIYPGGALKGMPPIPEDDPSALPQTVKRFVVVESTTDTVVGTTPAETIYAAASGLPPARRKLVTIEDGAAGDHFAPALQSAVARKTFWPLLDRLVTAAR